MGSDSRIYQRGLGLLDYDLTAAYIATSPSNEHKVWITQSDFKVWHFVR